VIAFLDDVSVLDELRAAPGEVACIFDHPLEALLDPELLRDSEETLVPRGSEDWPYETEFHVSCPRVIISSPLGSFMLTVELLGRLLVVHYVSHAPFPKYSLACERADGRHSSKYLYTSVSFGSVG